jgi:carbamoyl-phosphate synthase large subunit
VLEKYGVELIGASERAIRIAEDREEFTQAMIRIGLQTPQGRTVHTVEEGLATVEETGYPAILRPSFTLGGTGGGIAYNRREFEEMLRRGLDASPVTSVLVERSIIGWKEYELEVMRDGADNVVIVCSSRTSTRWVSTPATRSRSRRR